MDKQQEVIAECWKDKCMTINGRDYVFTKFKHEQRRKVFAFLTSIVEQLEKRDMSFLDTARFKEIEQIMCERITLDDMQISKIKDHWEEHPEDYLQFVTVGMQVIAHPFTAAVAGS